MRQRIDRPVPHLGAGRILAEEVVAFPVLRRPDGPRNESAATVRTHVPQNLVDTRRAERALVTADARLERSRRQRLVAVLAGGSELKHEVLPRVNQRRLAEARICSYECTFCAA